MTVYLSDPIVLKPVSVPTPPEPRPCPILGWHVKALDGNMPVMVNHNGYDGPLLYSNETIVAREYNDKTGEIFPKGKVIVQLGQRHDWQKRIEEENSLRILWLFIQQRFGLCDTGDNDNRQPYSDDEIKFGCSIDCGGNRRNVVKLVLRNGKWWAIVEAQEWNASPNKLITYDSDPQLMVKQVDAVSGKQQWRTSEVGDCVWPWVAPGGYHAHELSNVTLYPQLPFDCMLFGYPVTVTEYLFSGSDTWVYVDAGLLSGWYQADGMDVPPDRIEPVPGNDKDYFCNITGVKWPQPTPPVAGWRKE